MNMNCNIIKDLLPSYVDGLCSEDTCKVVENHLEHCEECRRFVKMMEVEPPMDTTQMILDEVEVAKEPFKRINKKRRIQVLVAIVITFMITVIGTFVVQENGAINQNFFPREMAFVNATDNMQEWESLKFNDQNYLIFDSIFWNKEIINDASNEWDILLRVKDKSGHIVIDEVQVPAGKSVKLDGLKRNEKYFFEVKAPQGRFWINAT